MRRLVQHFAVHENEIDDSLRWGKAGLLPVAVQLDGAWGDGC
jgi:hypothetical protein